MTPITNELVKEFFATKYLHPEGMYKEFETFLASKQAKDWEVVEEIETLPPVIKSVRRLPDGEIFKIDDKCSYSGSSIGKIIGFDIYDHPNEGMMCRAIFKLVGFDNCYYDIKTLHKLPERKPLFVSDDNVNIYDGQSYYCVDVHFSIHENVTNYNKGFAFKRFSTRAAAEQYVKEHKPDKSNAMIRKALLEYGYNEDGITRIIKLLDKQVKP